MMWGKDAERLGKLEVKVAEMHYLLAEATGLLVILQMQMEKEKLR